MVVEKIRSAIGSALGGVGGGKGFPRDLAWADFNTTDVAVVTDSYRKLGEMQVPAQQSYQFGYGSANQERNQGFLYHDVTDTAGAALNGLYRLVVETANDITKGIVAERRTEVLRTTSGTGLDGIPLPLQGPTASEDQKLSVYYLGDAAGSVDSTQTATIPVTAYFGGI